MKHAPGVMCLITGAHTAEGMKNIGKVVTLIKFMKGGDIHMFSERKGVCMLSLSGWLVQGDLITDYPEGHELKDQKHLMPIDGYKEDHKQRELEYGW